jgi:hypothetical protein
MGQRIKGSTLVLHLSKPWEVGEALRWMPLPARIDRNEGDRWLVELREPFQYGGTEFRYFMLSPRLEGWQLSEADAAEVPCEILPIDPATGAPHRIPPSPADGSTEMVGSVTKYRH